jgi:hypothetical protein
VVLLFIRFSLRSVFLRNNSSSSESSESSSELLLDDLFFDARAGGEGDFDRAMFRRLSLQWFLGENVGKMFHKTCLNCPSFRRLFVGVRDNEGFFSGDRGGSATERWSSELPERLLRLLQRRKRMKKQSGWCLIQQPFTTKSSATIKHFPKMSAGKSRKR